MHAIYIVYVRQWYIDWIKKLIKSIKMLQQYADANARENERFHVIFIFNKFDLKIHKQPNESIHFYDLKMLCTYV